MTFEELYRTMLKQAVEKGSVQADDLEASAGHLDCLLHPQDHPLVWPLNPCTCPKEETHCAAACLFDAIVRRDDGTLAVDPAGRRRAGVQGDDRGHPLRPAPGEFL